MDRRGNRDDLSHSEIGLRSGLLVYSISKSMCSCEVKKF